MINTKEFEPDATAIFDLFTKTLQQIDRITVEFEKRKEALAVCMTAKNAALKDQVRSQKIGDRPAFEKTFNTISSALALQKKIMASFDEFPALIRDLKVQQTILKKERLPVILQKVSATKLLLEKQQYELESLTGGIQELPLLINAIETDLAKIFALDAALSKKSQPDEDPEQKAEV